MVKNSRGLTLLEVLLSITILSFFLIAFSTMIGNGMKANDINQHRLDALLLGQECLELTKTDPNLDFSASETSCNGTKTYNQHEFTISRDLASNGAGLYAISVTISGQTGSDLVLHTQLFKTGN